jgi:hypothetical protein
VIIYFHVWVSLAVVVLPGNGLHEFSQPEWLCPSVYKFHAAVLPFEKGNDAHLFISLLGNVSLLFSSRQFICRLVRLSNIGVHRYVASWMLTSDIHWFVVCMLYGFQKAKRKISCFWLLGKYSIVGGSEFYLFIHSFIWLVIIYLFYFFVCLFIYLGYRKSFCLLMRLALNASPCLLVDGLRQISTVWIFIHDDKIICK